MEEKRMEFKEYETGVQCDFFGDELERFVFTKPRAFTLKSKRYEAETWVDFLDTLCSVLMKKDNEMFKGFLEDEKHRRNRIPYLSKEQQDIHFLKYLEKSGLFLNQKIDAPRSVKLARKLLQKYKMNENDFSLLLQNNPYDI
jgi:hypothetical protein